MNFCRASRAKSQDGNRPDGRGEGLGCSLLESLDIGGRGLACIFLVYGKGRLNGELGAGKAESWRFWFWGVAGGKGEILGGLGMGSNFGLFWN